MMTSTKVFNIEPNKDPFYGQPTTDGPMVEPLIEQTTPINPPSFAPVNKGWICPVCGRGNAPFVTQCPCRTSFGDLVVTCETVSPLPNFCGTTETRPLGETSLPNTVTSTVETPKNTTITCCNGNCGC